MLRVDARICGGTWASSARPTRPAFGTGLTLQREPAHATHCWRATGHSSCCRGSTFLVVAVRIVHCRARVGVLGTGLPMRGRGQASPLRCCRQVAHVWPVATPKRGCSARLLRNLDRKPQRLVPALAAVESADCACVDCSSIATCAARASAFAGASRVRRPARTWLSTHGGVRSPCNTFPAGAGWAGAWYTQSE